MRCTVHVAAWLMLKITKGGLSLRITQHICVLVEHSVPVCRCSIWQKGRVSGWDSVPVCKKKNRLDWRAFERDTMKDNEEWQLRSGQIRQPKKSWTTSQKANYTHKQMQKQANANQNQNVTQYTQNNSAIIILLSKLEAWVKILWKTRNEIQYSVHHIS